MRTAERSQQSTGDRGRYSPSFQLIESHPQASQPARASLCKPGIAFTYWLSSMSVDFFLIRRRPIIALVSMKSPKRKKRREEEKKK